MGLNQSIARSHLESLIEKITGVEKAVPDDEGDYRVVADGAPFFARVDGEEPPIVRVYAVVLEGVEPSSALLERLNEINTRLTFSRAFWVQGQVIIESEHLGLTLDPQDCLQSFDTIASACDYFGPRLAGEFGGDRQYEEGKDPNYRPADPVYPGYL